MHGLYIVVCVFGVFLLAIVLSVLLLTDSDYPFWYLQTHLSFPGKVKTVTVNNVTNMNYTNTNLLPENIQLRKSPRPMAMEMYVMAWDRHETRFK